MVGTLDLYKGVKMKMKMKKLLTVFLWFTEIHKFYNKIKSGILAALN